MTDTAEQNLTRSVQEQTSMEGKKEWKHSLRGDCFAQRQAAEEGSRNGTMNTTRTHVHMMLEPRWRPLAKRQDVIMATV